MTMDAGPAALWTMLLLGAFHGVNPGMGWLFAVALGLQERRASAVARSLVPMAIGHGLAIASVVTTAALLGAVLPVAAIRAVVAVVLIALGILTLQRSRHPRWVRMQVGFRDLAVWSFLVASAHGAGLMVVPVLVGSGPVAAAAAPSAHAHPSDAAGLLAGLLATGLHTAAYLATTGLVGWVVYRRLGLSLLRRAWFNFDLAWAVSLIVTGVATLVTGWLS
jgi:hypothetical protein